MKQRSIDKYRVDEIHKENVRKASVQKYSKDDKFRENLLRTSSLKYKTDESFRSKVQENSKHYYHSSPSVKRMRKENVQQRRLNKKIKLEDVEEVLNLFKRNTARGPDFACCSCHRLLFKIKYRRVIERYMPKVKNLQKLLVLALKKRFCINVKHHVLKIVQNLHCGYVLRVIEKSLVVKFHPKQQQITCTLILSLWNFPA